MIHIDQYRFGSAFNVDASFIFNGTDEYLEKVGVAFSSVLTAANTQTFSLWFYSDLNHFGGLLGSRVSGTDFFFISYNNGTIVIQTKNGIPFQAKYTTAAVSNLAWHHLLVVRESTANPYKIYIDGAVPSITVNNANIGGSLGGYTGNINIGGLPTWPPPFWFNGNMCHVALWDSDQSANLASIYNGGTPPDLTSLSPDLWYQMNQDDTLNVAGGVLDSSGNAVHISGNNMDATNIDTVNFPP